VEVYQTGPGTSYFIQSDRSGRTTSNGVIYSAPMYAPEGELPSRIPNWSLRDPLGLDDPLGLRR
jgi:hypothetical protein